MPDALAPDSKSVAAGPWHVHYLSIPLWLLAAICLAWPVTSLLLARRRRKGRGFAVEPLAERMKDEG